MPLQLDGSEALVACISKVASQFLFISWPVTALAIHFLPSPEYIALDHLHHRADASSDMVLIRTLSGVRGLSLRVEAYYGSCLQSVALDSRSMLEHNSPPLCPFCTGRDYFGEKALLRAKLSDSV